MLYGDVSTFACLTITPTEALQVYAHLYSKKRHLPSWQARRRNTRRRVKQESQIDAEHKAVRGGILYKRPAVNPTTAENPTGRPVTILSPSPRSLTRMCTLLRAACCKHYRKGRRWKPGTYRSDIKAVGVGGHTSILKSERHCNLVSWCMEPPTSRMTTVMTTF